MGPGAPHDVARHMLLPLPLDIRLPAVPARSCRYMMHFTSGPMLTLGGTTIGLWRAASYACTPLFAFKQVSKPAPQHLGLDQPASHGLRPLPLAHPPPCRLTYDRPHVASAICQLTNIVQLYMACEALVEDDEKKRKEA